MRNILYILLLFCCTVNAQPKFFFHQRDNSTHFGANLEGLSAANEIIFVRDSLKFDYIRHSVNLNAYTTGINTGLQQRYNAKLHVILNLNYLIGSQPRMFVSDLTTYANKLDTFLYYNWQFLVDGVTAIENEPFNAVYFNYDDTPPYAVVADYINELSVAIPIFRKYNLKVIDGATHLNYYSDLITLPVTNASAKRADTAMTYYAALGLQWVNYHFVSPSNMGTSTAMTDDIIKDYTTYGKWRTGHNYSSNEFHQEVDGASSDWDSFAASIVQRTRQAHLHFALVFGGDGVSDAIPLVDNGTLKLTDLGRAYRDAVTPP